MKLAVSNIAWLAGEKNEAYALLQRHGVRGLEIAPGLLMAGEADPFAPSARAVAEFRAAMAEFGLEPVSMQSLLFGTAGAQLFGTSAELTRFEESIHRALNLADRLDIANLVFGSPGNRGFPDGLSEADALARAADTFWRLGERAAALGRTLAIEPTPAVYGTNFLTTVDATAQFVAALRHPAISLNFDIGALHATGEAADAAGILDRTKGFISHVHISEPMLAPAPADAGSLADIIRTISDSGYHRWYSIEMRRADSDPLHVLDQCIQRAKRGLAMGLNPDRSRKGDNAD